MVSFPMSVFLCIGVLSSTALGADETESMCDSSCPTGWTSFGDRCFQYVATKMNWVDAESHCLKLGGNLASVHSEEEHQFLRELYKRNDPTESPFWVGLTDRQKEGTWLWSDGSEVDFTRWNSHEPNNNLLGEDCVHTNWPLQKGWNDFTCNFGFAFICALRTNAVDSA
ncbi:hypothetical protein MATL_G00252710 [Megalops atlanticus]|uniref:C-type lectin domain-containing protein n=1 Tax=Megalops atlanticus TaxID=7932 RepID=A0A9D3PAZ4_MEGAT|nr:hypothetical protein MATL_G00252710 [Megalops atlanticus]